MIPVSRREFLYGGASVAAAYALPSLPSMQERQAQRDPAFVLIDEFVNQRLRELNAPGMVLSIADRDGAVYSHTYGLADLKTKTPVNPNHLFEIGSISKSFAAICALQLHEEGRLDLHKPIQVYLPWLEIDSGNVPITTHHLLSHTSGLPGWPPLQPRAPFQKLWVGFEPGTQYWYSNIGYQLIGLILEKVDGQPSFGKRFYEVLRRRVLHPLKMYETAGEIFDQDRSKIAVGYSSALPTFVHPPGGPLAEAPWIEMNYASGSVISTGPDMAKYMMMLLNRGVSPTTGDRVLKPESFDLLSRPVHDAPSWGAGAGYGYGVAIDHPDGRLRLRHTGGMVAFSSAMHVDITDSIAAFASTNCRLDDYRPNEIVAFALDVMRAKNGGKPLPPLPPPDNPAVIPNAAEYAGRYGFLVSVHGSTLSILLSADVSATLLRVGPDDFACRPMSAVARQERELPPHSIRFGRQDGKVVELFMDGEWFPNQNYNGPRQFDYPKEWNSFKGSYQNNDPWFGRSTVTISKGQLTLDRTMPLVPLGGNLFRAGKESYSPERVSFDVIADGKAMRMNFSGQDFNRV